jgi:tetrahydromethanopterin S-methyltransferase subunit B
MLHDVVVFGWVIGFALATLLAISIVIYQNYKKTYTTTKRI